MSTIATWVALLAVPILLGWILGFLLRSLRGRRLQGLVAALVCVALPPVAAVAVTVRWPLVGLWDAAVEGLLTGVALVCAAHGAFADARRPAVLAASVLLALVLLETLGRLLLPPPPGFPPRRPHLLLADALRIDSARMPWDTRCKEIVCAIAYEDQYGGLFDPAEAQRDILTPRGWAPRPGAVRRVLHLGDSMAFGFGLPREETFTAVLERLEPGAQHVNAAVPGTAPDAYFVVLQRWIELHDIDLAVMHIYEGNDLDGLDSRYPCCGWQSLLRYDDGGAVRRCAQATPPELGLAGLAWLRHHNPPPFLLRALVGHSHAAAYAAAAMTLEPYFLVDQPAEVRLAHLEQILRATRALLEARRIGFVAVVLPARTWIETQATWQHHAPQIVQAARRAGVPVLDGSEVFRAALARGRQLFFDHPNDIHFGAGGHAAYAEWLHGELPAFVATPVGSSPPARSS